MTDWSAIWPKQGEHRSSLYIWLDRVARVSAALGGIMIFSVALAVALSVLMRNIGLRGIRGDFELVEFSCVFAAGLFLPLCQLHKGHVMVDLFTEWLPFQVKKALDWLWLSIFALAWAALCYLTMQGLIESKSYDDRTMLLSAPLWWTFVPSVLGTAASCLIALSQASRPHAMSPFGSGD